MIKDFYNNGKCILYNGDCVEIMKRLADGGAMLT